MDRLGLTPDTDFTRPYAAEERITAFLRSVYGWMAVGLGITALVAFYVAASPAIVLTIARNRPLMWGLMLAPLGVVVCRSARVQHMARATSAALLFAYYSRPRVIPPAARPSATGQS